MRFGIIACGMALPGTVYTNEDLVREYGPFYSGDPPKPIQPEQIVEVSGIKRRRFVTDETSPDLAYRVAVEIINKSGINPRDIGCIIVSSSSPWSIYPSTACLTQEKLFSTFSDMRKCAAFDISAACAGSVYGLAIAYSFVASGLYKYVLVIASEVMSKTCSWKLHGNEMACGKRVQGDWKASVLFGDMAAGVLVGPVEEPSGFIAFELAADGRYSGIGVSEGFGTGFSRKQRMDPRIHLEGRAMYKLGVDAMVDGIVEVAKKADRSLSDIEHVILHQANQRMMDTIETKLRDKGLTNGRIPSYIGDFANCSSASAPAVLCCEVKSGNIKRGDLVAISAVGSGLSSGACLLRW
ncbi:MAG: hypothetical protein NT135_03080 [Candidatus Berkelbacteria bacterium]|nr:hypothetical protein [Candidatus Berkelbacteria bacterium]